ncbi:expressed unknown protein [Seminavis robusta]|uniref:Uncharacterized protein n=1 Tax=Seminavis robusta TaxID=568900 RepID=A0A9N8HRH6_9STRA|nr:expressed unknown protein [Seminavis robusta]|eukprot:Sro1323_g262670.1 n/a (253) ;mRNA; r:18096-18854
MAASSTTASTMSSLQDELTPMKNVRFNDTIELVQHHDDDNVEETTEVDDHTLWFSVQEVASFREDTIRIVQAVRANQQQAQAEEEELCTRGLEKKLLQRPPPNFVKRVLALQAKQRRSGIKNPATGLQLFSEACSKWARKRAVQLAAEDEFEAYQIFMAGLRKQESYNVNDDDDDEDDDDFDADYYGDEEFDFCTEGEFVHDVYDYKHDPTEDETEYDDSDVYDNLLVSMVDDDGLEREDEFDMGIITPAVR